MPKFTTYLDQYHIEWLRSTALAETKKRGKEITAARLLRELVDEEIKSKKLYNNS